MLTGKHNVEQDTRQAELSSRSVLVPQTCGFAEDLTAYERYGHFPDKLDKIGNRVA